MRRHSVRYQGKTYASLSDFYKEVHDPAVSVNTFYCRIRYGYSPIKAATMKSCYGPGFKSRRVSYGGQEFQSILALYKYLRHKKRVTRHHRIGVSYSVFIDTVNKQGVEAAVKRALGKYESRNNMGLKAESQRLEGADNLVCQRMKKLGWSYEKAISTPRNTLSLPKKCRYKGKTYRSITACFKAIQPSMSYPNFVKFLKDKGCVIG